MLRNCRQPHDVMSLDRLGSMHQTRLSFMRIMMRKMIKNNWKITKKLWAVSNDGLGVITYEVVTPKHLYTFVIFSNYISDEDRNDRVIANKWDITCALVQGSVNSAELKELENNVPLQENGRNTNKVLVLSRANKSVRVFNHIIESLSQGKQPDLEMLNTVGYILRTTAVYGNGKFGIQDFNNMLDNEDFNLSFCAQMFTVYMLREFSFDLIDFLVMQKNPTQAVTLRKDYKRYLGVGNATGLGMSLFLINHPCIIDNWLTVRECALLQVAKQRVTAQNKKHIIRLLTRASIHLQQIYTDSETQKNINLHSCNEILSLIEYIGNKYIYDLNWEKVITHNTQYSLETQEVFISCILELYPTIVDKYENDMNTTEYSKDIIGVNIEDIKQLIKEKYQWALSVDFSQKDNVYWFWYISKNKAEPRLGVRGKDHGDELELPLDIARQVKALYSALQQHSNILLTAFLIKNPKFRTISRRIWTMGNSSMGEIQTNIINKEFLPTSLLRCKLALFGATKFDPRSDRWVRVTFFQNAPLLDEKNDDDWLFPVSPSTKI